MAEFKQKQIQVKTANGETLEISLYGRLDINTTAPLWQSCLDLQKKYQPKSLTVDADNISYCDGACIGLLLEMKQKQTKQKQLFKINGLEPRLESLMEMIESQTAEIPEQELSDEQESFRINLGHFAVGVIQNIKNNITFLGVLSYHLFHALIKPHTIRWKDVWFTMEDVGPRAFPIIALIGFLIGLISTFQAATPFSQFGAQIYIVDLVGLGLVREMGPLMTAVLLAGRTASSFAAEIGTMKINQEIDALSTMGINPIKFLTVPRVLATTIMTPLLSIFLIVFGLLGCAIVMHTLGYPLQAFMNRLKSAITLKALFGGLIKTFAFGIVISSVGCLHGLKTRYGASAVGSSTTQAVVTSIIMIVIVDGIFAIVYYALGI